MGCVVQRISVPVGLKMNIPLKSQTVIWVPAHWILLITFTNSSYGAGNFFKKNCYNLHSNFHSSKECNVITESRIVALISGDTSSWYKLKIAVCILRKAQQCETNVVEEDQWLYKSLIRISGVETN